MGYHEWLLLNEALEVEHPVFVINLANRSGGFQRQHANTQRAYVNCLQHYLGRARLGAHVYRL